MASLSPEQGIFAQNCARPPTRFDGMWGAVGNGEVSMDFSKLVGRTLVSVVNEDNERIVFRTRCNEFVLFHSQNCCESVRVQDINGDLEDLIGTPILDAIEATSNIHPIDYEPSGNEDSYTWTFYRIVTIKGTVVIRWKG